MIIEKQCSICTHSDIDAINDKLISGVSLSKLAEQYNCGKMSLSRHKRRHLPKTLIQAQALQEQDAADKLLERLDLIYDRAWSLVEEAASNKKYSAAASCLKEGRATIELVAKLIGQLKTGNEINITYNAEFIEVRQLITQALAPYPEAKEAVIKALGDGEVIEVENEEGD